MPYKNITSAGIRTACVILRNKRELYFHLIVFAFAFTQILLLSFNEGNYRSVFTVDQVFVIVVLDSRSCMHRRFFQKREKRPDILIGYTLLSLL